MSLTISSTAFAHNAEIPSLYTCEGKDISPPLAWSGAPAGTKSLALIVDPGARRQDRAGKAMQGHILAQAVLLGTYQKRK